jgi:hypothetical protein
MSTGNWNTKAIKSSNKLITKGIDRSFNPISFNTSDIPNFKLSNLLSQPVKIQINRRLVIIKPKNRISEVTKPVAN